MTATPHYIIRGGMEGRERLRRLASVLQPTTLALLQRVGIESGMTCLDGGCGGGDVSVELARLVGPSGYVVGADLDETKIALARSEAEARGLANLEFQCADVTNVIAPRTFDVIYIRFLLSHLPNPARTLAELHAMLNPGGCIIVEDVDITGHFWDPASRAFDRYIDLYVKAAQLRGADATVGTRIPGLLRDVGFDWVEVSVIQPAGFSGDVKMLTPLTLESIAASVLDEGLATEDELGQLITELYAFACDPNTLMSFPRIVQTWGFAPAG
jgi:SAM-dependent methyltransferase